MTIRLISVALFISFLSLPIFAAEKSVPETSTQISHSKYVWGGVAGTALGFGIGHAVQERYLSGGGWTFTLCEGLGAAAIITGAILYSLSNSRASQAALGKQFMLAGGIFYGGFRIWEAVDVWVAPNTLVTAANDQHLRSAPIFGALARW